MDTLLCHIAVSHHAAQNVVKRTLNVSHRVLRRVFSGHVSLVRPLRRASGPRNAVPAPVGGCHHEEALLREQTAAVKSMAPRVKTLAYIGNGASARSAQKSPAVLVSRGAHS